MSDHPLDPFRVLSLPYDADSSDVRRAFRRLARQTHPDRGGSVSAFHDVRDAYNVLIEDLEGQRRRWRTPPTPTVGRGRRAAARLDPQMYPTCPVRISRSREGKRIVEFDVDARPRGWRPSAVPPPGGECRARYPATEDSPAFGVWIVPLSPHTFRCVFGPAAA